MIDPAHRVQHSSIDVPLVSTSGKQQKSQSFTAALSDELGKRLNNADESSELPANFALGQQNVTRRDSVATPVPAPTSNSTPSTTTGSTAAASTTSSTSFDDAYWAKQPAAVQQLRDIQDPTERADLATQLTNEGYSIDVPIMVWGWDPQITTEARESMGYTWVPSALQQPVEVAPGLTFNGTSYNPSNPPAGSITV